MLGKRQNVKFNIWVKVQLIHVVSIFAQLKQMESEIFTFQPPKEKFPFSVDPAHHHGITHCPKTYKVGMDI